ncbi:anti-sigma factor antagonist [Oscillospiraceae bacterium]|nr:anti-sigma factor antagonist [Oscillospiraceae bacterium]BDF76041.1 anti-sigma factor antagonist [Oscillospiraceae bacterium]
MAVTCTGEDRALTLHLSGEVDHHGAREMMAELERCVDAALPRSLTLDLGGVSFMDSSGIAVLLRAYKRLGELGGSVRVTNVPAQAARVLKAAGLNRLMKFE